MEVDINGRRIHVDGERMTLSCLLEKEGFAGAGRAVAVNNRVVPRGEWDSFVVEEGMKLTVIRAVCGG